VRAQELDRTPGQPGRRPAQAPAAGPARPAELAAAGLSPQTALALQRSIGNAAVSRLVEQSRHQHGAGCGHAQSAPAEAPAPVQRMDELKKQFSAATSLFGLRKDQQAQGAPRQQAVQHIRTALEKEGLAGKDTVGARVADSIDGIKTVAGEHGSRTIDTVFKNPALLPLYLIPNDDPRAAEAHRTIARAEYAYWAAQHAGNPTVGTKIATDVDVETRVRLQNRVGGTAAYMRRFQDAFQQDMGSR